MEISVGRFLPAPAAPAQAGSSHERHIPMGFTSQKLKARLAVLRAEQGATDPMLVLASIILTLILVVGGTFMITNIVTSGHNLNAQNDLNKVAVAEASYYTVMDNDAFVAYGSFGVFASKDLEDNIVGFRPTEGSSLIVMISDLPAGTDWAAASESQATDNPIFIRTNASNKTIKLGGANIAPGEPGADVATAPDMTAVGLDAASVATLVMTVQDEN